MEGSDRVGATQSDAAEPRDESVRLSEDIVADKAVDRAEVDHRGPLAAVRRERDSLKEENLRLIAEGRNQAARFNRERQSALKYANADFARELLVVLDDLERTQKSAVAAADVQSVVDAARIVYEHFLKVLKSWGVEPIQAIGREFDPTYHHALLNQASDEHARGVVIEEAVRGYKMHERVLRPASVIVSSGPAAAREDAQEKADDSDPREDD